MGKDKKGRARIVITDDNLNIREGLKMILENEGYEVDVVNNGYELFAYLKKKSADLIILDIMMPEKDGLEALSTVKNVWPGIKIIIYSGHERYENCAYAREADKFIVKGGNPQKLLEAISSLLA